MFGSLKAREWWDSDMMPAIFLGSAIISGISLLILLYASVSRIRRVTTGPNCMRKLCYILWGFLIFTLALEFLEFINITYKGKEGID